jgi:hypothetical protein
LDTTTLQTIGLSSGSGLLRLLFKNSDQLSPQQNKVKIETPKLQDEPPMIQQSTPPLPPQEQNLNPLKQEEPPKENRLQEEKTPVLFLNQPEKVTSSTSHLKAEIEDNNMEDAPTAKSSNTVNNSQASEKPKEESNEVSNGSYNVDFNSRCCLEIFRSSYQVKGIFKWKRVSFL